MCVNQVYINDDACMRLYVSEMTESVAMEEYGQMVAEGIQRQKTHEKEVNNNIRDNYMDRLGVNSRSRDTNSPNFNSNQPINNRVSAISMNTYDNVDFRSTQ